MEEVMSIDSSKTLCEVSKNVLISKEDNESKTMMDEKSLIIKEEHECDKINTPILSGNTNNTTDVRDIKDNDLCNIMQITPNECDDAAVNICQSPTKIIHECVETSECNVQNDVHNNIEMGYGSYQSIDKTATINNDNNTLENNLSSQVQKNNDETSSLGIIALEYETSDSDMEEIVPDSNKITNEHIALIPETQNLQQYRLNMDHRSSSEETDSEDDSSSISSSSSSSSNNNNTNNSGKSNNRISAAIIDSNDSDSADSNSNNNRKLKGNKKNMAKQQQIRSELDDLPPIEDLKISVPEVLCDPLGEVAWMVEQLVIVKPRAGKPTLNLDTVLFVDKGQRALGKIFDVFGPVSEPHYCVRFNSSEHIQKSDIKVGMLVYFCPNTPYTSLVFLHELIKMKGTDAVGDDEPPEFSDDEEERAYYEMLKQQQHKNNSDDAQLQKRKRTLSPTKTKSVSGWQSNHPWNRNAKFQGGNKRMHQGRRNNHQFNSVQNESYSHNTCSQYPYQDNLYWPPSPNNIHPMFSGPYHVHMNQSSLPQPANYNSNSSGSANQYSQDVEINTHSSSTTLCHKTPFDASMRLNAGFPLFPMNQPHIFQYSNARFPYINMPYPVRPPIPLHVSGSWSPASLPPPPPPLPPSTDTSNNLS